MELVYGACLMGAFWVSGIIYGGMQKRREHFLRRLLLCTLLFAVFCAVTLFRLSGTGGDVFVFGRLAGFCILILFQHTCWEITWSVAAYGVVWAVTSWQLIYALLAGNQRFSSDSPTKIYPISRYSAFSCYLQWAI